MTSRTKSFSQGFKQNTIIKLCLLSLFLLSVALLFSYTELGKRAIKAVKNGASSHITAKNKLLAGKDIPEGLTEVAWTRIKKLIEIDQHRIRANKDNHSYTAYNRRQDLSIEFTDDGFKVTPGKDGKKWEWGLRVKGYGYGDELIAVSDGEVEVSKNRIDYRRGRLVEWYVNQGRGLEQGFTIENKPDGRKGEEAIRVMLEQIGILKPVISSDKKTIEWVDSKGGKVLRYSGLYAYDAKGRELESGMGMDNEGLWIEVRDQGAEYPIVIDPFIEQAKLTASDAAAEDYFGVSVSISGDTVVVGAFLDDCTSSNNCGSAYVFVKPVGGWADMNETAKLTASDAASDFFGYSVSISGDTVVVGALFVGCAGGSSCGSAYVFKKPGGGWVGMTETAKLTASDAAANDYFGYSVSISGDTVVVGAPFDDCTSGLYCGSAYVFGPTPTPTPTPSPTPTPIPSPTPSPTPIPTPTPTPSPTPNTPPNCSAATPSVSNLWLPDHKFVSISIFGVTDPDGDPVGITISSIHQDEPTTGTGSGDTCPDVNGVGTNTAQIRAERSGNGDGRVYHISFTADDGKGGKCTGEVKVCVPHDQGNGSTCVDEGPLFDSTVCK